MKVYCNENNSVAFKLFISAEYSKQELKYVQVSLEDGRFQSPKRLPVLELESGEHLFSSNAASYFIFPPPKENLKEVNKWLKWESTELMPALVLIGTKSQPSSKIDELVSKLNAHLKDKTFIVKEKVTIADICIWASLYPLFTEEKLNKQFLGSKTNLLKWYDTLNSTEQFKNAVKRLKFQTGIAALKSVSASCWYPADVQQMNSPTSEAQKEVSLTEEELAAASTAWENGFKEKEKPKKRPKPVLPVKGEKNILITSALPYVNNIPHLGNIIGCVLSADVFARFSRLRNWNTLYVCGTDEYGTATETKALEEGLTPQQICDKYFEIHREIYSWFNIQFDYFGRTTHPNQTSIVQDLFTECYKNGYTITQVMDQLLCEKCDRYLADRFVEGVCPRCKYEDARGDQCDGCGHLINAVELIQPKCKVCKTAPVVRKSQQLFLDLPKLEEKLNKWCEETSDNWTHNASVISKAWLKDGLKPRCITRDLKWGVPVPLKEFENKVFYVWFDAPIGYMSMTKTYTDKWLDWWKPQPETKVTLYQFMAKDNVPFHSIMFPATLFAVNRGYTIVNHLMATEYLNYEDGKFSKSRGVGVFGNNAKDTGIPSDIFRFYLLYVRPESQDSSFSWADLAIKNNSELLNNLGNFVNRALMFTGNFFGSLITPVVIGEEEKLLLGLISRELKGYISSLEKCKLRDGIRYILNISRHGNQYMQSNQPWVLVKGSENEKSRAGTVVSFCCNIAALICVLIQPYMPQTSEVMAKQLNLPANCFIIPEYFVPFLAPGHKIGKPSPLFTKIEDSQVNELKAKYAMKQVTEDKSDANNIPDSLPDLEKAVQLQAEKVRKLKTSGVEKAVWQPEVNILLDLKKKLALASSSTPKSGNEISASELEAAVAKQGEKVRQLKTSGAEKSVWQPEVEILLDLKKKLALANSSTPKSGNETSASELEAAVAQQGEKVRQLKTSGAEKSVWQPEVEILLDLKKKLAAAQGVPAPAPSSGKRKNKK